MLLVLSELTNDVDSVGVTQMLVGIAFTVDIIGVGAASSTVAVVDGMSVPAAVETNAFISSGLRLIVILFPAPE